jgi:hypothetical protein
MKTQINILILGGGGMITGRASDGKITSSTLNTTAARIAQSASAQAKHRKKVFDDMHKAESWLQVNSIETNSYLALALAQIASGQRPAQRIAREALLHFRDSMGARDKSQDEAPRLCAPN